MASIDTETHSAADLKALRRWRFSLGTLFRAITVVCLALFALVQFGPLAAARDLGFALAIAVALLACGSRSVKMGLAAGLLAVVGLVPTILAAGAPFSERSAVCCECGMTRDGRQVCGWTTKDEIIETEVSRWAAPMVPANHVHTWQICSDYHRTHWFGSAPIGCGGPREGAPMAWQLVHLGDPDAGERAFQEYLDILAGKSPKSMAVHRQEVEDAVNAAVQARR